MPSESLDWAVFLEDSKLLMLAVGAGDEALTADLSWAREAGRGENGATAESHPASGSLNLKMCV